MSDTLSGLITAANAVRHLLDTLPDTFPTGAMCATCGWECEPGDTVDRADADHAAFDPAHEPMWHAND